MISPNEQTFQQPKPYPDPKDIPAELHGLIGHQMANGVSCAIPKFFKQQRANFRPGTKCTEPLVEFSRRLMAEWAGPEDAEFVKLHPYPFKDSLKKAIMFVTASALPEFNALWGNKEIGNLEALCRVLGHGETLQFLEDHRGECLQLLREIRGDDLVTKT